MNPFGKTEYQKALNAMVKAESEIARNKSRLVEVDEAITRTLKELAVIEQRMDEAMASDKPLAEVELAMEVIGADREKLETRVEEYQRMRARQATDAMRAKVDVLAAEQVVQKTQRGYYESLAADAATRCVAACKESIRELWVASAAAAYHQAMPRGEGQAENAYHSVDIEGLVDAAMVGAGAEYWAAVDLDSPPKGAPPIRAVKSSAVNAAERASAQDILRSGAALTSEQWSRSLEISAIPKPGEPDNRYQAGQMERYWSDRVEVLELSVQAEQMREYPANGGDGYAFNPGAVRARRLGLLQKQIVEAKEIAATWRSKLPSAA